KVCKQLNVPVGAKEVGFGIEGTVAKKLYDCGVSFIDVAGAGGTSWSQVEKLRTQDELRKRAAEAFNQWGNPTKRSEEHTSELQSRFDVVCRLLLEKKKRTID